MVVDLSLCKWATTTEGSSVRTKVPNGAGEWFSSVSIGLGHCNGVLGHPCPGPVA